MINVLTERKNSYSQLVLFFLFSLKNGLFNPIHGEFLFSWHKQPSVSLWPSETNSSCISITWERLTRIYYHTSLLSCYFPILFILSLFLITLTFLPLLSIPYMFNLIYTNILYIFNSITLIHHSSNFFYSSPPTKPSPILYLEITSRHHQFSINKFSVFIFRDLRTNKISYL